MNHLELKAARRRGRIADKAGDKTKSNKLRKEQRDEKDRARGRKNGRPGNN